MYLNTAPPGWKALSTGADMVLGIAGGAAAFNVNGGNPDSVATWVISGLTADAHTHTGAAHTHTGPSHVHSSPVHSHTGTTNTETVSGVNVASDGGTDSHTHTFTTDDSSAADTGAEGTGATGSTTPGASAAASATGVTASGAWRPKASVGKLFQLDTV